MAIDVENLFPQTGEMSIERITRDALQLRDYTLELERRLAALENRPITTGQIPEQNQAPTPTQPADEIAVDEAILAASEAARIDQELAWIRAGLIKRGNQSINGVMKRVESITAELADQVAVGAGTQTEMVLALKKTENTLAAAYLRLIATAQATQANASAILAAVAQISSLETNDEAFAQAILELETTVQNNSGELIAQAQAIIAIQSQIEEGLVSAFLSFETNIPPSAGILTEINLRARATQDGDFVDTGLLVQLYDDGGEIKSRIAFVTDKFIITDGDSSNDIFTFEDGQLKLRSARFEELIAGIVRDVDSNVVLDTEEQTFIIYEDV